MLIFLLPPPNFLLASYSLVSTVFFSPSSVSVSRVPGMLREGHGAGAQEMARIPGEDQGAVHFGG